jgi:hypothetical protein
MKRGNRVRIKAADPEDKEMSNGTVVQVNGHHVVVIIDFFKGYEFATFYDDELEVIEPAVTEREP